MLIARVSFSLKADANFPDHPMDFKKPSELSKCTAIISLPAIIRPFFRSILECREIRSLLKNSRNKTRKSYKTVGSGSGKCSAFFTAWPTRCTLFLRESSFVTLSCCVHKNKCQRGYSL